MIHRSSRGLPWRAAVVLFAGTFAITANPASGGDRPFGFTPHGHFQRMMHTGDAAGRIALADLPQDVGRWGLGATEGLEGELVQLDGRLWVTPGTDAAGNVRAPVAHERAALFAGARVARWHEVVILEAMDRPAFEAFVEAQAEAHGLSLEQPFVFRVEGRFPQLLWHVVTGTKAGAEAAVADRSAGHDAGRHGHPTHAQPGSTHARPAGHGGHANRLSDLRLFRESGASGQLVGVYSGSALEGVVTHPGERFHLHFVDPDATRSGHVDRYAIDAGAVLRLPAR